MKYIIILTIILLSFDCQQNNTDLIYNSLIQELKDVDTIRYTISIQRHEFKDERILRTLKALRSQSDFSDKIPSDLNVSYSTDINLTIPKSANQYLDHNKTNDKKSDVKLEVGYGLPIKLLDNYYCYFSYYHYYEGGKMIKGGSERVTILKHLPNKKWQVIKTWHYLDI